MKSLAKALHDFVGGFGLPAYTPQSIPKDVSVPYLVYPLVEPRWDEKATFYIQGWYRTTSNAELTAKADAILREIGEGVTIKTISGYLVIYPETPLVQIDTTGDYRTFYINLSINSYQMPGAYPDTQAPGDSQEEGE